MPLVRYFVVTSGLLLGLLFVLSWYMPAPPAPAVSPDIDRSTMRIHSNPKWPEAVQIDTSVPIATTAPAATETPVIAADPKTETPAAGAVPTGGQEAYAPEPSPTHKTATAAHHHTRLARAASGRNTRRFASYRAPGFAPYRPP